jgi:hypothetical protein
MWPVQEAQEEGHSCGMQRIILLSDEAHQVVGQARGKRLATQFKHLKGVCKSKHSFLNCFM